MSPREPKIRFYVLGNIYYYFAHFVRKPRVAVTGASSVHTHTHTYTHIPTQTHKPTRHRGVRDYVHRRFIADPRSERQLFSPSVRHDRKTPSSFFQHLSIIALEHWFFFFCFVLFSVIIFTTDLAGQRSFLPTHNVFVPNNREFLRGRRRASSNE